MADYKKLVPFIKKWEGGYVNDPLDRGGATNQGVTFATWKVYCKKHSITPTISSLKNMTEEQWQEIFKTMYWDVAKADKVQDQNVANIIVDWLWNSGNTAIRHVQQIVGVRADGIVGPKTLAAINGESALTLFGKIRKSRVDFVYSIVRKNPKQERFLLGWLKRIDSLHYE